MIKEIKKEVKALKGKNIKIEVDIGRNKTDIYEGYILDLYDNVWTFKTSVDVKSFSYNDILTKNVILSL